MESFPTFISSFVRMIRKGNPFGITTVELELVYMEAASKGDIPRLKELVRDADAKALLATISVGGLGALQMAARLGKLDVVKFLVEDCEFDVDSTGDLGLTALCYAAFDGESDIVGYLLARKADPNKANNIGQCPLHCAAKEGHGKVAEMLLLGGAEVNRVHCHGSALHMASFFGHIDVMKVLLEHGANPDLLSDLGTPLLATLIATEEVIDESIALKCVNLLLKAGADVNCTEAGTDSALVIAVILGLKKCATSLLKAGANPNIPHRCCDAKPIEFAANYGARRLVRDLLDSTSPVVAIKEWTVDGILSHFQSKCNKLPVHKLSKRLKRRFHKDFNFFRMTAIPAPDITIIVKENDPDPFGPYEQELRDLLANHPHKCDLLEDLEDKDNLKSLGPHPYLEGQTNDDPPTRWIHVMMTLSGSTDWIMLIVRADNVYVKGFANGRNGTCFCYEIIEEAVKNATTTHRPEILPVTYLSVPLPWDVKYNVLLHCKSVDVEEKLNAMAEDPTFVADTIRHMSSFDPTMDDGAVAMARLAGLIFKFCEYARMNLRGKNTNAWEKVQS